MKSWIQLLQKHAYLLPWRDTRSKGEKARVPEAPELCCGPSPSEVRIVHVGKNSSAGAYVYCDTCEALHPMASDCTESEENYVPFLDDCDEEEMAAQIAAARRYKSLRRGLRGVHNLLSRQ